MEKFNSTELFNRSKDAKDKIEEGQEESSGVQKTIDKNLDLLTHEASTDYLAKLKKDLTKAVDNNDTKEAGRILNDIASHNEAMEQYKPNYRKNIESYFDKKTGEVDLEKLKVELDSFMAETFLMWYGKEDAKKAKISGEVTDLSKLDFDALLEIDKKLYGEYTINQETAGINYQEKEPKIKIFDMKEFIGKPVSKVLEAVVEKYSDKYYIPGFEYEKYLLENPDKIPEEMKDGNVYYFAGSVLRDQYGNAKVPCVSWYGSRLNRDARWLSIEWLDDDRILLLEK